MIRLRGGVDHDLRFLLRQPPLARFLRRLALDRVKFRGQREHGRIHPRHLDRSLDFAIIAAREKLMSRPAARDRGDPRRNLVQ
jgi:hypothetical protein